MDFTREPIIESVVTPKEGCKLVIRSSKGVGQEEFFVDAVEIVSFGGTFFLRSKEKPKAFLVPATDYEILEIREARMVLKNASVERTNIKIAGGKTEPPKRPKEPPKMEPPAQEAEPEEKPISRKKERRKQYRKKKDAEIAEEQEKQNAEPHQKRIKIPAPESIVHLEKENGAKPLPTISTVLTSLLPPPSTLISESIERYKENELFKNVFIPKEELAEQKKEELAQAPEPFEDEPSVELEAPERYDHYAEDDIFGLPPVESSPEMKHSTFEESPLNPSIPSDSNS